jgi:PleD family two-component response regulator
VPDAGDLPSDAAGDIVPVWTNTQSANTQSAQHSAVPAEAGRATPSSGGGAILVVEDDLAIAEVLEEALEEFGYEVAHVQSGAAALAQLQRQRPDLILLDLSLPDVDGLDLCRQLRAEPRWNSVPVIALTARDGLSDRVIGLREGLDDYLTKPFSVTELAARVDANLRRSRRELHTSPLTLLPGNRAIEVALSSRLADGRDFAVCYLDINDFKPYNDRYGFAAGDRIIQQLAELVQLQTSRLRDGFAGHIGGDDFVAITEPPDAAPFAERVLEGFAGLLPSAYTPEDYARGGIEGQDRSGARKSFPLMGLSIAVVVQQKRRYQHIGELSRAAAEIKGYLKRRGGSSYMVERRSS